MLEKTRSIGQGQRSRGSRTKVQRYKIDLWRGELGGVGQPRGNTGKKNSLEGGVMP